MLLGVLQNIRKDMPDLSNRSRAALRSFGVWLYQIRADILIAVAAGLVVSMGSLWLSLRFPMEFTSPLVDRGAWFESDIARLYKTMNERGPHNYRTNVHPLMTLMMYGPTKVLVIAGLSPMVAVLTYLTMVAGLAGAFLFAALRGLGLRRPDALVFTALGVSCSAWIFWTPVPEIYGISNLFMLIGFALGTAIFRTKLPMFVVSLASACTFALTSTNWMAGILLAFRALDYRRAIRATFDALLIVTLLFAVQKAFDANSQFFIPGKNEFNYVLHEKSGDPLNKVSAFFLYSVALPEIPTATDAATEGMGRISAQLVSPAALPPVALAALAAWFFLLGNGLRNAWRDGPAGKMVQVLATYVLFEIFFHLFYGDELFLYSLNYVPAMVLIAATAALGTNRKLVVAVAVVATALLLYNNVSAYIGLTTELDARIQAFLAENPGILDQSG